MKSAMRILLILLLYGFALCSHAAIDAALLKPLAADDADERIAAVGALAALANDDAARVLQALAAGDLYAAPDGRVLIATKDQTLDAASGKAIELPDGADAIVVNNRLRGAVDAALSGLALLSPERGARLGAALALQRDAQAAAKPLLDKALAQEKDAEIKAVLQQALARIDLASADARQRQAAIEALAGSGDAKLLPLLSQMLEKSADGAYAEPDEQVRIAAARAVAEIRSRAKRTEFIGNLFYGISLGSVLLLAALGLAITFGLMGVINMAHGELLMLGAYATYGCQLLFRHYAPAHADWYLLAAVPAGFLVAACIGMLLERTVIRWLYGRPLETLLATWGISLILMQAVRSLFGAQNVEVANPSWMSGGVTVLGSLVLSYNRLVIIGFAIFVVGAVWLILNKTRLGLFVRAVTQNRRMADCVGVATGKIDMLTFGLGSGIAGLGGVALSQLGNVGPDLGQGFIVDSFMVVVLGGVGQLAGTIIAALGLGEANKFLEPFAGAVLAKIAILVFIIMFIQKRPQGLFALKGRSAE
jgi:urea transport system permease protein